MGEGIDLAWRSRMLDALRSGDVESATDALLSLTYDGPDSDWMQDVLLDCLRPNVDTQVRALAVTCFGHVARLAGKVRLDVVEVLHVLVSDPVLGGRAEDALDDVASFVQR
ncbi:hypothetical protein [Kibdelosporangium persicum]|uniref:hypothetical protein n=1 Tax=Kibdelosporangium persicum TaxID=2698649 RepID=UPI0015673A8C|nr:hypothetical protein [Kibdelosporangium persicum]